MLESQNEHSLIPSTKSIPSTSGNPLRSLVGKLVFLDLNSYKLSEKVKECLNLIGANLADCLSKDVNYVITNRETNNDSSNRSTDAGKKFKTSPNALSLVGSRASVINRTQTILEKASKGHTSTDLLSTARRLGINVMNITEIERYIEKYLYKIKNLKLETNNSKNNTSQITKEEDLDVKKISFKRTDSLVIKISPQQQQLQSSRSSLTKTNHKIIKLKTPFLKFESICKQYRPNYQEFNTWHEINSEFFSAKATVSPFQIYFSEDAKGDDENGEGEQQQNSSSQDNNNDMKSSFKSPTSTNTLTMANSAANISINSTIFSTKLSSSILTNCSNTLLQQKLAASANNSNNTPDQRRHSSNKPIVNSVFLNQFPVKRKVTGYCECCKQRYDNLKQHLTSTQHENFDRNMGNFKELDEYIDGVLNFRNFLTKNNLEIKSDLNSDDSINMDEIRNFAKTFNQRRKSLGYSHSQVIQSLDTNQKEKDPVYNEINLARFERLDITPRSTAKMKPGLEKWLVNTEIKFSDRLKTHNQQPAITPLSSNESLFDSSKKRKRISLSPKAIRELNQAFNLNSQPNENDIVQLSSKINQDKEAVRTWFIEKTKSIKKNTKKYKQETVLLGLVNESGLNTSTHTDTNIDTSAIGNTSFSPLNRLNNSSSTGRSYTCKSVISSFQNPNTSQNNTPYQLRNTRIKRTPSLASSLSLSSPAASVLFSTNNKKMPENGSKLLASRIEFINSTSHVESIRADDNLKRHQFTNNDSTDLSYCEDEDDNGHGFLNNENDAEFQDFSFEMVQK